MTDNHSPPRLKPRGMFIGAVFPFSMAGDVFEFFYSRGVDPKSFELAPAHDEPEAVTQALNELQAKIGHGTPLQITDRTGSRRRPRRNGPDGERRSSYGQGLKGHLLGLLSNGPANREYLKGFIKDSKWSLKSLDSRLYDLKHDGLAALDAAGTYSITRAGLAFIGAYGGEQPPETATPVAPVKQRKANGGGKSGRKPKTQEAWVRDTIKAANGKSVTLEQLRKLFVRKNFRPESVSVAINVLKDRGEIARVDKGAYAWIDKQTQQETQTHGE